MAEICLTLGCPEVVRLGLEDICTGIPVPGAANGYAVSCIRNWKIEPITREGDTSEFVSDCGRVVSRDVQDDQLLGYTISFETSQRSPELEALVTGKTLISSGGSNIGTYATGPSLGCSGTNPDPRFTVEAFYKLAQCVTGANHVRILLPNAQFQVTELDKEGTITYYRYTAKTSSAPANALGTQNTGMNGPFDDLPADVVTFLDGRAATEYTVGLDFQETITISGQCGAIPVPTGA